MDEAKIKEVFSDEEFATSLLELETPEEVREALAGRGVELSVWEVRRLRDMILWRPRAGRGELSDDDLLMVAGGVDLGSYPGFNSLPPQLQATLKRFAESGTTPKNW